MSRTLQVVIFTILFPSLSIHRSGSGADVKHGNRPPNIVWINLDLIGTGDLSCFGGMVSTPHLDALAKDGLRFSRFTGSGIDYFAAGEFLTGYPSWVFYWSGQFIEGPPQAKPLRITCPHVLLRKAGYEVYHTGEWDGYVKEMLGLIEPTEEHIQRHLHPTTKDRPRAVNAARHDLEHVYQKSKRPEALLTYLKNWDRSKPLFVSWTHGVFWGLYAREDYVAAQKGKFSAGPIQIAEQVYRRQVELGLYPDNKGWVNPVNQAFLDKHGFTTGGTRLGIYPVTVDFIANDWDSRPYQNNQNKDQMLQMEVYAAMLTRMDETIGKIVKAIKDREEYENTLFVIGASAGSTGHHNRQGTVWAAIGSSPFLGESREPRAGGRIAPLIMCWPLRTPAPIRGSIIHTQVTSMDLAPTIVAAAGCAYPDKDEAGNVLQKPFGRNVLQAFSGELPPADRPFVMAERVAWRGIFDDRWSGYGPLPPIEGPDDEIAGWRIYNLKEDPFERNDVSAQNPELIKTMKTSYREWEECLALRPSLY